MEEDEAVLVWLDASGVVGDVPVADERVVEEEEMLEVERVMTKV